MVVYDDDDTEEWVVLRNERWRDASKQLLQPAAKRRRIAAAQATDK